MQVLPLGQERKIKFTGNRKRVMHLSVVSLMGVPLNYTKLASSNVRTHHGMEGKFWLTGWSLKVMLSTCPDGWAHTLVVWMNSRIRRKSEICYTSDHGT